MRFPGFIALLMGWWLIAQPSNDDCQSATLIAIPDDGYGVLFNHNTTPVAVHNATRQIGEYFPPGVPNGKSIWYRFYLPTTRTVRIILRQVGNVIPVEHAGWTLYRGDNCLPGSANYVYPPIQSMEGYTHACLRRGWYLVQVGISNAVTDPSAELYLDFSVYAPDPAAGAETDYDHGSTAQNLGLLSGSIDGSRFEVSCQSVRRGENICGTDSSWSKSTWHVFRTDGHVDWVGIAMQEDPWNSGNTSPREFRVSLYKGDVRTTDSLSLVPVRTCVTFTQTGSGQWPSMAFLCSLEPNTWYSIQVLYRTEYGGNVRIYLRERGTAPAVGYDPTNLPATHQLGLLSGGADVSRTDYWSCEAHISRNVCPSMAPSGMPDSLALYYTFSLSAPSDVEFEHSTPCGSMRVRIFSGNSVVDGCNLPLYYEANSSSFMMRCMPPGSYTVQVLGHYDPNSLWYYCHGVLGYRLNFRVRVTTPVQMRYGLRNRPNDADLYNNGNPILPGTTYYANWDTIDCGTTILPAGDVCGSNDRAIYRIININQNGILEVGGGNWWRFSYRLYRGDARHEPVVNGRIQNLIDQAGCQSTYYPFKVCVTPGIYTLVSFADPSDVGERDRPWIHFHNFNDRYFYDPSGGVVNHPNVGPGPQYIGALQGNVHNLSASPTRITCEDNPLTILGYAPCGGATKQFYWEFYIHEPSLFSFHPYEHQLAADWGVVGWRTFRGRISDGSLTSLYRDCHGGYTACMEPGWYTVVAYAVGGTYSNPTYSGHRGRGIGNQVGFSISRDPRTQKFGTFATAHRPGNLDWGPNQNQNDPCVPALHRSYPLEEEFWPCANNLPFPDGIEPCLSGDNRVSYRVFSLTKPSYVVIDQWGSFTRSRLYYGDITTQTPPYQILHDCTNGPMHFCWLPPGSYTLVTFANDGHIGSTYAPTIYVDSVSYSLHEYAAAAYDFGDIPADNQEYRTKPGDPLAPCNRPGSTDWIFCTTSAVASDPNANCPVGNIDPTIPSDNPPAIILPSRRRNLWYTFTVSSPGYVHVSVYAVTPGTGQVPAFAVYESDDFDYNPPTVVDSTTLQGLRLVVSSQHPYYCCPQFQTVSFYRDPCQNVPKRYYIVVHRNTCGKYPNIQIEVGIRVEPLPPNFVLYDHYHDANVISDNPTTVCGPPYPTIQLPEGTYTGCLGDLTCATRDPTDKNGCGNNTIWYRFTSDITGYVYISYRRPPNNSYGYNGDDIQLYYDATPGDPDGLQRIPLTSTGQGGRACVRKGYTYYIMITGCNHLGYVIPRVILERHRGDYCQDSLKLSFSSLGTQQVTALVNCFTIGEAPGESDPTVGCLGSPRGMKSAWFLVENNYTDTVDFDVWILENTTAVGEQVKYRIMLGDCNVMNPDECVAEGAYVTLHLKCRPPGMPFWVHVLLPEWAEGEVTLKVTAKPAQKPCNPPRPECPVVNFSAEGGCVNTPIPFVNYSTSGAVNYFWDFGDGNTSTVRNPSHTYTAPGTYKVWLKVDNGTCVDSTFLYVIISPKPGISVTYPAVIWNGVPFTLNPTYTNLSSNHVQYIWNFCAHGSPCDATPASFTGPNPPPIEYSIAGTKRICVTVINDYGLCDSTLCFEILVRDVPLAGGPYDGAGAIQALCQVPGTGTLWAGGPYDGAGMVYVYCATPATGTFWAGGPYDGASLVYRYCVMPDGGTIWAGGPYDGASLAHIYCITPANGTLWAGGPYDGASLAHIYCITPANGTLWAGGPYDGADAAIRFDDFPVHDAFVCEGSSATLSTDPRNVNWYTSETGGQPVHSGSSYTIPSLNSPMVFYVRPCGRDRRVPIHAIPVRPALPRMQVQMDGQEPCAGRTVFTFTNQTLVPGPSTPTVGTLITGVSNTPGTPGTMTFSSSSVLNFSELYDGINQEGTAWTPANTSGGRVWVEWTYPDPRSVNRLVLYRCQTCPNAGSRSPVRLYLYYHDGTTWRLAHALRLRPNPNGTITGLYDTGVFSETAHLFYARWRLELEVNQPFAPPLGELQIYASEPVVGGTAYWSLDGGSTWQSGASISHVFGTPGTHTVLLTVQSPANTCTDTLRQTIEVSACPPLSIVSSSLVGVLLEGKRIQLKWRSTYPAQYAVLYKLNGLLWEPVYVHRRDGDSVFTWIDEHPFLSRSNVYRVESYHSINQSLISSNVVEITLTPEKVGESIRVYPNPTAGTLYLETFLARQEEMHIRVYDSRGAEVLYLPRVMFPEGSYRLELNTRMWAAGLYTLQLEGQTHREEFRVMKVE